MAVAVGLCGVVYQALKVDGPDRPGRRCAGAGRRRPRVPRGQRLPRRRRCSASRGRSFFQEWRLSFKDILLPYVSMAPLGALAAYTYQATPWALLYFPPLVLVVYDGFKLFVSLQRETDNALVALADSIDRRDKYTYEHSLRVAERVAATARTLGLAPREVDLIVAAARVHDLGKIATDNRVLLKPTCTHAGRAQAHREARRRKATSSPAGSACSAQGRRFIRHHHERWDGTGYPDGLAGAQIPLGARLITVADSFDAMTTDRPYRKAAAAGARRQWSCATAPARSSTPRSCRRSSRRSSGELRRRRTLAGRPAASARGRRTTSSRSCPTGGTRHSSGRPPASRCRSLLDVPNCDLYRLDEDGASSASRASARASGTRSTSASWPISRCGRPAGRRSPHRSRSSSPRPSDARLGDAERAEMLRWNETAKAIVPLIVKDEVIGLVETGETRRGPHDDARSGGRGRVDLSAHRPGRPRRRGDRGPEAPGAPAGVAAGVEPRDRQPPRAPRRR